MQVCGPWGSDHEILNNIPAMFKNFRSLLRNMYWWFCLLNPLMSDFLLSKLKVNKYLPTY